MPEKFLLIKAISHSMWKNINHLMESLLIAEVANRIPVVYWGTTCYHNKVLYTNAFDLYFEPISSYSIYDVINKKYSYYPPIWKYDNVTTDDTKRNKLNNRNIGDLIGSDADVVVSDVSIYVSRIIPFLKKDHPAYGMTPLQVYRYLFNKYLKLKPDIQEHIQEFYNKNFSNSNHTLAIHLPGDFTLDIYPQIKQYNLNKLYHPINPSIHAGYKKVRARMDHFQIDENLQQFEVVRFLNATQKGDPYKLLHPEVKNIIRKFNIDKIYLVTDREDIIDEFTKKYESILVYSDCERIPMYDSREPNYLENHLNKRKKGIESILDAYIASMCDFFIGYGFSNFSYGVTHLKDWADTNIKLAYWKYDKLYNFSYEYVKSGRYSPEEADGKYKLRVKKIQNSIKRIQSVFK